MNLTWDETKTEEVASVFYPSNNLTTENQSIATTDGYRVMVAATGPGESIYDSNHKQDSIPAIFHDDPMMDYESYV